MGIFRAASKRLHRSGGAIPIVFEWGSPRKVADGTKASQEWTWHVGCRAHGLTGDTATILLRSCVLSSSPPHLSRNTYTHTHGAARGARRKLDIVYTNLIANRAESSYGPRR